MTPSQKIIKAFGGRKAAALALGTPVTTIQHWEEVGHIPAHRQARVLAKAREMGLRVRPGDFVAQGPA